MSNTIQDLLRLKSMLTAKMNLLPYSGTPEVKERGKDLKYIYIRKRVNGKLISEYIGNYSELLFNAVAKSCKEYRALNKELRKIEKELTKLGYEEADLSKEVILNLDFGRANMKSNIYDQAILEGVLTTYPQTETIIENGKVYGMTATDVQKILNLKRAWEFILDKDVIQSKSDYYLCCYIAKLVNEGFYEEGGRIRTVPVSIGGSSYLPPIPLENKVKEDIFNILSSGNDDIDVAIELLLYVMKTQVFNDGNKRTAVIYANHYLISKGKGLIVIPEAKVSKFKKQLIAYYENKENNIEEFLKEYCWKRIN